MQTVGMGAECNKESVSDETLQKAYKELKRTMKGLIAENKALHDRIGEPEEDLRATEEDHDIPDLAKDDNLEPIHDETQEPPKASKGK